jgi:hypothetical protein
MGTNDGSIIATIITVHMHRNAAAAPGHDWPGIRIHAIDIVQPPGMGMSSAGDMPTHHATVAALLARNSDADAAQNVA